MGLSQSPSCKADVVTTLAARLAQVIGQSSSATGPEQTSRFWGRRGTKRSSQVKPQRAVGTLQQHESAPAVSVLHQLYNRLTEPPRAWNASSSPETRQSPLVKTSFPDQVERVGFLAQPIFVCSGGASSMLSAHRIHHYVRGIMHSKGKGVKFPLRHDVDRERAQVVDIADECFYAVGNGFYSYQC